MNFKALWINFFHACSQLRFKKWWLSINFYGVKHCSWQHAIFYKNKEKNSSSTKQQLKMYESSNYKCGLTLNNTILLKSWFLFLDFCLFHFLHSQGLEGSERSKIGEEKKLSTAVELKTSCEAWLGEVSSTAF